MINFAHGEMLMVGVFLALPVSALGAPAWLVLLSGIAGATLMGLLVQWAIYRPLLKSPRSDIAGGFAGRVAAAAESRVDADLAAAEAA